MGAYNRVLVDGTTSNRLKHLLPFARQLAERHACPLHVVGLVELPQSKSLSAGALRARRLRGLLEKRTAGTDARYRVVVTHDRWSEWNSIAGSEAQTLTLLDWRGDISAAGLQAIPGDVALLRGRMPARLKRILLAVRGGPHAELALRLALALVEAHGAEITIVHAEPPSRQRDKYYRDFLEHLQAVPAVTRRIIVHGDVVHAIATEAPGHQLVVMGAMANPRPNDPPAGPTVMQVLSDLKRPALIVRSQQAFPPPEVATSTAPPVDHTISVVVDKWFAENSFHASEFADLTQLVALKQQRGLTISLGLPALNEEATVGSVIRTAQQLMTAEQPLLDEIVLIDSMSTDRTVEIAASLGVPVYRHPAIMPQCGSYRGKGEALWKSLAVLKGDLIAWIDTDIENMHPRFIYGVLGPLIREPHLMYVKGYYQRPLHLDGKVVDAGGGRVTELVARPLLNLFYPELSGVAQPLSGEYAGRRSALLQAPFFSGYGVEMGMLIDMLTRFGLGAIGQVDLEERIHHGQTLGALSRMSFAIIQVVMQRLGDKHETTLVDWMNQSLKMIRYGEKQFELDVQAIHDVERPPMASVLAQAETT